jgi:hypothetical protein
MVAGAPSRNYVIVWGPDADRRVKLLICLPVEGSLLGL